MRTQHVYRRHRKQRSPNAVPADVEQVDGEPAAVEPSVAETVAPERSGAFENPVGGNFSVVEFCGQQTFYIVVGFVELVLEGGLAFLEPAHGLVSFEKRGVRARVVADSRDNFELVGKLHHIVVGAVFERAVLCVGLFLRREHHKRDVARFRACAEKFHERKPVDFGHNEVLENHRRGDPFRRFERIGGIAAKVEFYIRLVCEHSAHGLPDDGLVVHEKHHDFFMRRIFEHSPEYLEAPPKTQLYFRTIAAARVGCRFVGIFNMYLKKTHFFVVLASVKSSRVRRRKFSTTANCGLL